MIIDLSSGRFAWDCQIVSLQPVWFLIIGLLASCSKYWPTYTLFFGGDQSVLGQISMNFMWRKVNNILWELVDPVFLSGKRIQHGIQIPAHPCRCRKYYEAWTFGTGYLFILVKNSGGKAASQFIEMLIPFIFITVDASSLGGCTATSFGIREDLLAISDFLIFEFSVGRQSGAGFPVRETRLVREWKNVP